MPWEKWNRETKGWYNNYLDWYILIYQTCEDHWYMYDQAYYLDQIVILESKISYSYFNESLCRCDV